MSALTYVVCDYPLDVETNLHCEFDGRIAMVNGKWTCPWCGHRRFGASPYGFEEEAL